MERVAMQKIEVEELIELLRKDGVEIEKKEAQQLLNFLYHLTTLAVMEYFKVQLIINETP